MISSPSLSFRRGLPALCAAALLSACSSQTAPVPVPAPAPAPAPTSPPVAVPASFTALGTEPFWSARVDGQTVIYATPEAPDGTRIAVTRQDGAGGARLVAVAGQAPLVLEVTRATCSDGMSDTVYPMSVVRRMGNDVQRGCAR